MRCGKEMRQSPTSCDAATPANCAPRNGPAPRPCFNSRSVVLDAPADLAQTHQNIDGGILRQNHQPVVGRGVCAAGPFDQQPPLWQGAVRAPRDVPVRRAHPHRSEPTGQHPPPLPWRHDTGRYAERGISLLRRNSIPG